MAPESNPPPRAGGAPTERRRARHAAGRPAAPPHTRKRRKAASKELRSIRSRRAKSPEVTEGGGARRGSGARSQDQGHGRAYRRAVTRCAGKAQVLGPRGATVKERT